VRNGTKRRIADLGHQETVIEKGRYPRVIVTASAAITFAMISQYPVNPSIVFTTTLSAPLSLTTSARSPTPTNLSALLVVDPFH
jgi:hypothetical protein